MANSTDAFDATNAQRIDVILQRLRKSKDVNPHLQQVLDAAITMTGADMGTLQRYDEKNDCLRIVASRSLSDEALSFFGVVRRDTNSTCSVALTRRMHVFVADVSTSYLFVGTRELDMLRATGVAAVQSTPLISSNGRLLGVFTTHFREPRSEINRVALDRLAVQLADTLEQRERLTSSRDFSGMHVPGKRKSRDRS
jgi:GAF domain-containing protein